MQDGVPGDVESGKAPWKRQQAGRQVLEEEVSCSRPGRAEVLQGTAPMSWSPTLFPSSIPLHS